MYPHLSGEEAEIGLVLFDSNAEVGPLQPLGIWGETRTPGFLFVFILFEIPLVLGMTSNSLKKPRHFHIML